MPSFGVKQVLSSTELLGADLSFWFDPQPLIERELPTASVDSGHALGDKAHCASS